MGVRVVNVYAGSQSATYTSINNTHTASQNNRHACENNTCMHHKQILLRHAHERTKTTQCAMGVIAELVSALKVQLWVLVLWLDSRGPLWMS